MPSRDTDIQALILRLEEARAERDEARRLHDEWFDHARAQHDQYDDPVAQLNREGQTLYEEMGEVFQRSKDCYASHDHDGAGYWSSQGKALKVQLSEVNSDKAQLITHLRDIDQDLGRAKTHFMRCKEQLDAVRCELSDRQSEVDRKRTAKGKAAAARKESKPLMELAEAGRALVKRLAEEHTQFRDDEVTVTVQEGFDLDLATRVVNIYIYHRDPAVREHVHAVFRVDTGEELMCEHRDDD